MGINMINYTNDMGKIIISKNVFTTLVGDAATSCFGVKGMAMRSVSDGLVHLLKKESMGKGVYISFADSGDVVIELHIIVDQGVNIPALCHSIISEVDYKVTQVTGVKVDHVEVFVDSIIFD